MSKKLFSITAAGLIALGLTACDVDKTREGNVTLPKYKVSKTQEGDVTTPRYDVKTPDVTVSKEERSVDVPTVKTEKRTVEVPKVDVTPAGEKSEGN